MLEFSKSAQTIKLKLSYSNKRLYILFKFVFIRGALMFHAVIG